MHWPLANAYVFLVVCLVLSSWSFSQEAYYTYCHHYVSAVIIYWNMFCHNQLTNQSVIYLLINTYTVDSTVQHSAGQQGSHMLCAPCDRERHGNQKIKHAIGVCPPIYGLRGYQMTVCLDSACLHARRKSVIQLTVNNIMCHSNTARGRRAVSIERFT